MYGFLVNDVTWLSETEAVCVIYRVSVLSFATAYSCESSEIRALWALFCLSSLFYPWTG